MAEQIKNLLGEKIHKLPSDANFTEDRLTISANPDTGKLYKVATKQWIDLFSNLSVSYKGPASTTTDPGTPTDPAFYTATTAGTYTNFKDSDDTALVVASDEYFVIFSFDGTNWSKQTVSLDSGYINDGDLTSSPGKNLFDSDAVISGSYVSIAFDYAISSNAKDSMIRIAVSPSTNYIVSGIISPTSMGVRFEDASKELISGFTLSTDYFTTPSTCAFLALSVSINNNNDDNFGNIQIEKGKVATDYESFSESIIEINGKTILPPDSVFEGYQQKPNPITGVFEHKTIYSLFQDTAACKDKFPETAIRLLEIYKYDADETFYLQTLENYYGSSYSGIAIESSKGYWLTVMEATVLPDATHYAYWAVDEATTGVQEMLLYDRSTNTLRGRIIIDWDEVPSDGTNRYVSLSQASPFISEAITKYIGEISASQSEFSGLKLSVLGDSITYGFIPRNTENYPGQIDSYAKLAAQSLGMSFQNNGISGSTVGNGTNEFQPFVDRYDDLDDDADIISVMGGTNDVRKGIPLGSFGDTDSTTFYGALDTLCLGLLTKYRHDNGVSEGKKKTIFFCTMLKNGIDINTAYTDGKTFADYRQAILDVCAYYSLPVFDAYNESTLNPHINRTLQGTETGYTDKYNIYMTDATHPNQEGHVILSRIYAGFIKKIHGIN